MSTAKLRGSIVAAVIGFTAPTMSLAQAATPGEAHQVSIAAGNDEWTSTGIKVAPGDLVVTFATGKVTVGQVVGEVDADGRNNSGNLLGYGFIEGKVGSGNPFSVGQRFPFSPDQPGTLKLRVHDTKYSDNSGAFTVTVIRIPVALLPQVVAYTPDE